jgi:urea transporter
MGQPSGSLNAGLVCYNAALLGAVMPALLLGPGSSTDPVGVWLCVIIGAAVT